MQGFNMGRYVPPQHEGTISANKLAGKHALGNRARKASEGVLVVRFEMPFAIWCTTCRPHETIIGQGVRFNAEKKKVGNYYSSPIYSFRMKHAACGGWIEIRTDPASTAYVVTEGARKRDTGDDRYHEGEIPIGGIRSEEEKERLRNDAFAALEVTIDDRAEAKASKTRIDELLEASGGNWDDPYAANQRLRKTFRAGRRAREKEAAAAENLKERMSLSDSVKILPETEEDRLRARLVAFGQNDDAAVLNVQRKSIFAGGGGGGGPEEAKNNNNNNNNNKKRESLLLEKKGNAKAKAKADAARESLRSELSSNTRAKLDPFLTLTPSSTRTVLQQQQQKILRRTESSSVSSKLGNSAATTTTLLPGIKKRKRSLGEEGEEKGGIQEEANGGGGLNLVDYDSD